MFKKTLLAAALVATTFGANAQLTVTSAAVDVSSQGLPLTKAYKLVTAEVTLSAADVSALTAGAKVQLEFGGAFVSAAPLAAPAYGDTGTNTTTDGVLAVPTITSTKLTSAFTTVPVGGTIAGDTVTFANIPLLLSSADVGTKVSVTASVLTASDVVVSSTTSTAKVVAEVKNQFAATVDTKADAKIDVANARKTFESKVKTDTIVIKGVTTGTGATPVSALVTVKGDYSDDITKLNDGTNDYTINSAKTEATFTYSASTSPSVSTFLAGNTTLTATVDGEDAIAPRSFSTSATLSYTDAETASRSQTLLTDADSGSWSLNGDSAYISFMPFGSAYSQSITVTNKGAVDGEISIDLTANGATVSKTLTALATAKSVTDISSEVRAFAAEKGVSNAAVNIVVNSPSGDIQIDALYYSKADKDRGVVLTGGNNN